MSTKAVSYTFCHHTALEIYNGRVGESDTFILANSEEVLRDIKMVGLTKEDKLKLVFPGEDIIVISSFVANVVNLLVDIYGSFEKSTEMVAVYSDEDSMEEDFSGYIVKKIGDKNVFQ